MLLKNLTELTCSGIWAFVNNKDKRIFISHSNNILSSVSRNISEIKDKSHSCRKLLRDFPNLDLLVLESHVLPHDRKIKVGKWMDHYRNKGWTLYKDNPPVSYSIKTTISNDYKVHILLVNKRNDKLVVGVFPTMDEATQFLSTNYPDNKVHKVIYSENSFTKEFNSRKIIKV
jgi:hypothetical protein